MPLAQASAMTRPGADDEPAIRMIASTFEVDHRLDLLDLRVGVALRVGDDELGDEPLLLELLDFLLDRALGFLHPGRHGIDVGPADGEGRLAVALDAFGRGVGLRGQADAGDEAKAYRAYGRFE